MVLLAFFSANWIVQAEEVKQVLRSQENQNEVPVEDALVEQAEQTETQEEQCEIQNGDALVEQAVLTETQENQCENPDSYLFAQQGTQTKIRESRYEIPEGFTYALLFELIEKLQKYARPYSGTIGHYGKYPPLPVVMEQYRAIWINLGLIPPKWYKFPSKGSIMDKPPKSDEALKMRLAVHSRWKAREQGMLLGNRYEDNLRETKQARERFLTLQEKYGRVTSHEEIKTDSHTGLIIRKKGHDEIYAKYPSETASEAIALLTFPPTEETILAPGDAPHRNASDMTKTVGLVARQLLCSWPEASAAN